ncbi:MAG: UbiA family prenyltransferase [Bacteroidetes bacterium]|nr:UbiA family prenyltransferase [Bacteroidota bacterium]
MRHYLKLARLPNILMVGLTLFLMRYAIIAPMLSIYSMELKLPFTAFLAFVLATMLVAAAGYVINDYFDRNLDLVNRKPEDVIAGKLISENNVLWFYRSLNILSLILAFYASRSTGILSLILCFPVMMGLLYFYSTTYKKQLLIGNIIVSIATALVPIAVYLYEMPPVIRHYKYFIISGSLNLSVIKFWILGFSAFAFISGLAREIIKDMEDYEGDNFAGRNTVPIVWGMGWAKGLAIFLLGLVITGIVLIYLSFLWKRVIQTISH